MPTIQSGCFIICTMSKTDSALNISDIKLIYAKYYSIGTVVMYRGEIFKSIYGFKTGSMDATSITVFHHLVKLTVDINSGAVLYRTIDIILTP